MKFLYNIFILLFKIGIRVAALFNKKAEKLRLGQQNCWNDLERIQTSKKPNIWIHCASLGEFEQARPLIEKLRKNRPDAFLLLTFFSPSGYEIRKNYTEVDLVSYIPLDTQSNAKKFLQLGNFELIFFVKYEFWFNFLEQIHKKELKCFLVSGIFWKKQQFFQFYGSWFAKRLKAFNHFFVQNKESSELLNSIGYANVSVSGDSRFDQVIKIKNVDFQSDRLSSFTKNSACLIIGSAWEKEIEFAKNFNREYPEVKILIAPHEIEAEKMNTIAEQFNNSILWTQSNESTNLESYSTLIVDTIGLLSQIYRYGHFALIGGGFGNGVHNTLEAATYGMPIFFGPNHQRFNEIQDLIKLGAGHSVDSYSSFKASILPYLSLGEEWKKTSKIASDYVLNHAGATDHILHYLENKKLV